MKKLLLLLVLGISLPVLFVRAQTNTNLVFGVPYRYFTNTNAFVFMASTGKQGVTTNNNNGTNWVLVSGSSSNQPMWRYLTQTNLDGSYDLARAFGIFPGSVTTNVSFLRPGPVTNYLCFTNGILMNIVSNAP